MRIDEQQRLLRSLGWLPEPYRSALFHRHIEGLSLAVVARRLGVPEATVAARLRHALRLLGAALPKPEGRTASAPR